MFPHGAPPSMNIQKGLSRSQRRAFAMAQGIPSRKQVNYCLTKKVDPDDSIR